MLHGFYWGLPVAFLPSPRRRSRTGKPNSSANHSATPPRSSLCPHKAAVEILKRQGGWTQVKPATAAAGWVRMLNLRMGTGAPAKQGGSGIGALFNVARSGSSGNTVTTGVRGLSEEDLRAARPNPQELKRMQQFSVSPAEAQKFASAGKLQKQSVEYVRSSSNSTSSSSKPASSWGDTP